MNRVRPKKKSVSKNLDQKFLENEVQVKNGSIFLVKFQSDGKHWKKNIGEMF